MKHVFNIDEVKEAIQFYLNQKVLKYNVDVTDVKINKTEWSTKKDDVESIEFFTVKEKEVDNAKILEGSKEPS